MKLYDIVFSPTGGTKKVADDLTGALEGDVITVDLTDSKQNFQTVQLNREDIAVISVPSYGGRVPAVAGNILSPDSLPPGGLMNRTQHGFLILPNRFSISFLRKISRSLPFLATVLTRKPGVPVWYPNLQRSVPIAAYARQSVLSKRSIRRTPKRWMKRRASRVCAASAYVPRMHERSILSCSLRPA